MIKVQITTEELRVCTLLAVERWLMKRDSVDRENYAKGKADGRLEPEINANIRSIVAEYAVAKATNKSWNVPWYPNQLHPHRKNLPDVGERGEVRTVRTQDAFPVWPKDAGKVIIGCRIQDTEYFSEVEIFGYVNADDIIDREELYDSYSKSWRVPFDQMNELPQPTHLIWN